MRSGRWGREKADVGAVESETEHQRVRQRGKESLQRRNGVALASRDSSVFPDATRSRHAREFPSPFLSLSFSLAFSSLSPSPPSLSLLVRDPLALSLRLLVRTSVPLYLPRYVFPRAVSPRSPPGRRRSTSCPASSRRARSGTNRSAASGNDDAPIGTRRRRIDADERRF